MSASLIRVQPATAASTEEERCLFLRLPEHSTDTANSEILSWDKNGDGDIDTAEVRRAAEALLRARSDTRLWKRSFVVLALAAAVAVALLFAITLATNELSKELKTAENPSANGAERRLVTVSGDPVAAKAPMGTATTLFGIPRVPVPDLAAVSVIQVPLPGFESFMVARIARAHRSEDASGLRTTVLGIAGGGSLTITDTAAELALADGTVVAYQRGPMLEDGTYSVVLLNDNSGDADLSVAQLAAARRMVVHSHGETGERTLVHLGVDEIPEGEHYDALRVRRKGEGRVSALQSSSYLRRISSRGRSMRTVSVESPFDGTWTSGRPFPGRPNFDLDKCKAISAAFATTVGCADADFKTSMNLALETCDLDFPLSEATGIRTAEEYAERNGREFANLACRSRVSVARCKSVVCATAPAADVVACEAACDEVPEEVQYGYVQRQGNVGVALNTLPATKPGSQTLITYSLAYGINVAGNSRYDQYKFVCYGYDFDASCSDYSLNPYGDPIFQPENCKILPYEDHCVPATVNDDGTVVAPEMKWDATKPVVVIERCSEGKYRRCLVPAPGQVPEPPSIAELYPDHITTESIKGVSSGGDTKQILDIELPDRITPSRYGYGGNDVVDNSISSGPLSLEKRSKLIQPFGIKTCYEACPIIYTVDDVGVYDKTCTDRCDVVGARTEECTLECEDSFCAIKCHFAACLATCTPTSCDCDRFRDQAGPGRGRVLDLVPDGSVRTTISYSPDCNPNELVAAN